MWKIAAIPIFEKVLFALCSTALAELTLRRAVVRYALFTCTERRASWVFKNY